MSDETTTSERVGFCQDCGKPLTKETARIVGTGMFCEPCLQTRLGAAPPTPGTGYAAAQGPGPTVAGMSHPAFAALLGFIPGVGAMYNGQFAKGIAHLVIFAVLVSLAKHVSDVFGIFVFAWICYMAFDAYHTARARRDGLPLPDPFGLNDIGEKMGFGKSWGSATQPGPQAPVTPPPPVAPVSPPPTANWAGYSSAAGASPAAGAVPQAPPSASYSSPVPTAPFSAPYTPVPMSNIPMPPMPAPGASFPLVAIWLIGLGVLFAVAEWIPTWRLNGSAVVAILLGAIAASVFVRRLGYMGGISYQGSILHMMRAPVILAVLAVLFLLQGVHAATLGQTWPVILLALGAVMLGERLGAGSQPYPYTPDAAQTSVVPPAGETTTTAATAETEHSDERNGYSR